MKKLIIILLCVVSMETFSQPTTGYYVWVRVKGETKDSSFISVDEAQRFLEGNFPMTKLHLVPDISVVLEESVLYEQRAQCYWIYCEKKRIVYKKNGKIKFKRIKVY